MIEASEVRSVIRVRALFIDRRFADWRHAHGLTQRDVGTLIGADHDLVHRWEKRRSVPSHKNALAIAALLDEFGE